jgi:hypothetical protein
MTRRALEEGRRVAVGAMRTAWAMEEANALVGVERLDLEVEEVSAERLQSPRVIIVV